MTIYSNDSIDKSRGKITAQNLCVEYGQDKTKLLAVDNVSFEINPREFVVFLGPSGSGKSTLLNVVAGFIKATSGQVYLDEDIIDRPGRNRSVVFQDYGLFPWMTVRGNVEFGLRSRKVERAMLRRKTTEMLESMGITGTEKMYPCQLSGGMQQRVAIARALITDPLVLLMDEPFRSLDIQTRPIVHEFLLSKWQSTQQTVIFVTHDIEEAIFLADRIVVLTPRPARIMEVFEVPFQRPRNSELILSHEFAALQSKIIRCIRSISVGIQ